MIWKFAMRHFSFPGDGISFLTSPFLTAYAAQCLATELYKQLRAPRVGTFGIIKVWSRTIAICEDRIRNTVLFKRAIFAPLWKLAERPFLYSPDKPVDQRDDEVSAVGKKTIAELFADAPREYALHCMARHVEEAENVRYFVPWYGYGYTPENYMVDQPEQKSSKHFITLYW